VKCVNTAEPIEMLSWVDPENIVLHGYVDAPTGRVTYGVSG